MKAVRVLLLALGIVGSIAVNLTANPVDITFTTDGLIQTGDDYDDVWVYGDTTTVDMTGGRVAVLWTYDQSTTNITGGLVAYAQTNDQSKINIGGGVVHEPRAWANGTISVTGGECWNVEVGGGTFNISGGHITGSGIYAPTSGSVVNVYGYGFAYTPFHSPNLSGFWQDRTPFGFNFNNAHGVSSYDAVVLHEVTPVTANAGGPYFLDQTPIMLGGSAMGDYSQAAWDLDIDGLFDDAFGLTPLISGDMLTSWGFSPGMTWDIGLQVTGVYGGVDTSMTQLTFVPVPSAVLLSSIGLSFAAWTLRKPRNL